MFYTVLRVIDGSMLPGDVGRLDAKGCLYLIDRKNDMSISGGPNIWPPELEIVIAALPVGSEVTLGGASVNCGEKPVAVVVLKDGGRLAPEQFVTACSDALGYYKTPMGRIQRKIYWRGHQGRLGGV